MKEQFQWELKLLHTDYTDMGLIHCVDDFGDLDQVMKPFGGTAAERENISF